MPTQKLSSPASDSDPAPTVDALVHPSALRSVAHIDYEAIRHNASVLVRRAGQRPVVADVSADGYGHGVVAAARAAIAGGVQFLAASHPLDLGALEAAGLTAWVVDPATCAESAVLLRAELYGLQGDLQDGLLLRLRPAMRVSARVLSLKTVQAGEAVSYGYTYRALTQTNLALVGIGYADGIDRRASNVGAIAVGGTLRRIAGRVAMNVLMLDLGADAVQIGAEAVVFGDPSRGESSVAEWAAALGITATEVVVACGLHLARAVAPGLPVAVADADADADAVADAAAAAAAESSGAVAHSDSFPRAVASIDRAAFVSNLDTIRARVAPAQLMVVVKADAYGHGMAALSEMAVAAGIRWFGSFDIAAGLALRAGGVGDDSLVFAWTFAPDEDWAAAINGGIDLGVSSLQQLEAIAHAQASRAANKPARLHLKIDTGLHRAGANWADWPALVTRAREIELSGVATIIGVWTHIAEASDAEDSTAIELFETAIALAESLGARFDVRHLAASASSLGRADARFDLVRVGAFCYGISPGADVGAASLGLMPVMTLTASVIEVVRTAAGTEAVLAIGMADGIMSSLAGKVSVNIGGTRCLVTAVELERTRVAVAECAGLEGAVLEGTVLEGTVLEGAVVVGATATLIGVGAEESSSLEQWADAVGTIAEEVAVRLTGRVLRQSGAAPVIR